MTNYITSNDLFSDFSSNTIEKLYEICDIIPFRENDTIVQQGEEASWVGFLIEGDLSIIVSGREVARCGETGRESGGDISYGSEPNPAIR